HLRERGPEADRRTREDEPGQTRPPGALRQARGDQAAHRMPEEDDRQPGVCGLRALDDPPHVVHHVLEVRDENTLARGAAVPEVIGAVHRGPARAERAGDVVVALDVLAVAVRDDDQAPRPGMLPDADAHTPLAAVEFEPHRASLAATPRAASPPPRTPAPPSRASPRRPGPA